jgi:hypothetical protein
MNTLESAEASDDLLGATRLAFYTPIRDYPPLADRKAAAILAADGLLISILLLLRGRLETIVHGPSIAATYILLTLLASFATLLLIGGYCAYVALTLPIPHMPESLAYFPEIARIDLDEYRARITKLTHRQIVHKMLIYNYSLSTLSAQKFGLVRRATACIRAEFFLWIIMTLVVSILS